MLGLDNAGLPAALHISLALGGALKLLFKLLAGKTTILKKSLP